MSKTIHQLLRRAWSELHTDELYGWKLWVYMCVLSIYTLINMLTVYIWSPLNILQLLWHLFLAMAVFCGKVQ